MLVLILYSFDLCMEYEPCKISVTFFKIFHFFDARKFVFSSRFLVVVYENEIKNFQTHLFFNRL